MRKVKSVIENIIIVVLVFFLVVGIIGKLQLSVENPYPSFWGYRTLTVLTGSMSPNINPGDIVIIREANINSIEVGDVVTYNTDNILVTHRVNQIIKEDNSLLFVTKGDANNTVDADAIGANQILGVEVFHIPYAGYVIQFVNKNFILFPFIIIIYLSIIISKENSNKHIAILNEKHYRNTY